MSEYDKIKVRDAMSSPVIVINRDSTAQEMAGIMGKSKIGSLVVIDKEGKPVGIVTDSDLKEKVVAAGLKASDVKAADIMSSPILTVGLDDALEVASDLMGKRNVKHLAVLKRGKLIGVLSSKDVAIITGNLLSIIAEKKGIYEGKVVRESAGLVGNCDRCDTWSTLLKQVDGNFLCEECRSELESKRSE